MANVTYPSDRAFSQMDARSESIPVKCPPQLVWAELAEQGQPDCAGDQRLYVLKLGARYWGCGCRQGLAFFLGCISGSTADAVAEEGVLPHVVIQEPKS